MSSVTKLYINVKHLDSLKNIISQYREVGHSWTRNGYNWLLASIGNLGGYGGSNFGAGYFSSKDVDGNVYANVSYPPNQGTAGTNAFKVVCGSGSGGFDADDYTLTGIDSLSSTSAIAPTHVYDSGADTWTVTHTCTFTNTTGSSFTISEVGLRVIATRFFVDASHTFLLARDVLSTPIPLADGNSVELAYEIEFDFSAID